MTDEDVLAGRYRRLATLGHGAMGEVWLAEDQMLGRRVAIKRVRTDAASGVDPASIERMLREARTAARLHDRHIVTVFDLIVEDGQPHVVMEYVDGESLAERIRRAGTVPVDEAARLIGQVASALEIAHRADIVHRDVKPANIMLSSAEVAKLADFGIARGFGDAALTDTGQMVGTIAYMAPEVARTGNATAASDVWSLGATLYAAIEGRAPHDDGSKPNTTQMIVRLVTEPVPPPQHAGELTGLILRMLSPNPADRPTAGEVTRRLAERAPVAVAAQAPSVAEPEPTEAAEQTQVRVPVPAEAEPTTRRRPVNVDDHDMSAPATVVVSAAPEPASRVAPTGRRRRGRWLLAAATVVVIAAGGLIAALTTGSRTASNPNVTVLTGRNEGDTLLLTLTFQKSSEDGVFVDFYIDSDDNPATGTNGLGDACSLDRGALGYDFVASFSLGDSEAKLSYNTSGTCGGFLVENEARVINKTDSVTVAIGRGVLDSFTTLAVVATLSDAQHEVLDVFPSHGVVTVPAG